MRSTAQLLRTFVLSITLLSLAAGSLDAQSRIKRKRAHRIFAAQTGPDQVTLAWDEVPGATEYRIYLATPEMQSPPSPTTRPTMVLGGASRMAHVQGVQRLANGAHLVAMGAGQVLYEGTFNAVARAPLTPISAPGSVQVQETGEGEVTVSWPPVPGATAYMIGRGVSPSGLRMACHICPPEAEYVDTAAVPGMQHIYSVQAWFPTGISTRTMSSRILVGAAQLAAAATAPPAGAVTDKSMSSGTPVSGTDADATNAGAGPPAAGTGTTTPTTTTPTTGTPTTGTPTTGTSTDVCPPGTVPATTMPKAAVPLDPTKPMASGTPVAGTDADATNAGAGTAPGGTTTTGMPPGGCVPVGPTTSDTVTTGTTTPPADTTGTVRPTTGTPPPGTPAGPLPSGGGTSGTTTPTATCRLEYQRADNMWAAFGRPDGFLGVESISLSPGQHKVFVTDWKYEKQANDGANFFGSHLRIATNRTARPVRLHLRTSVLTGVSLQDLLSKTGNDTFWVRLDPNTSKQFQADLMEVYCEH